MELNTQWNSDAINQYTSVAQIKKNLVKSNWSYLCNHPEIRAIIRVLLHNAINAEPDNVYDYATDLFNCTKTPLIVEMINKQLKCVKELLKKGRWTKYDGDMFFTDTPSTHSLVSKESTSGTAQSILGLSMVFPSTDECLEF